MKQVIIDTLNNWNFELPLTVKATFIQKGNDRPLTGDEYNVRLYDRDLFEDDYLGKSTLDSDGTATITFNPADFNSADSPGEAFPDLYLLLFKGDVVHFQSKVMEEVDFNGIGPLQPELGAVLDFGTFLVD